jgi:hypothetical protein
MDKPTMRCAVGLTAVFLASALVPSVWADDPAPKGKPEPTMLAKELVGTWILAGTPDKVGEPPSSGGRLKFFTGRHWIITQANAKTGKVIFHHGGTYSLDGDTYTEIVEYATESTANLVGKKFKFKVKVDGDTYTQRALGGGDQPVHGGLEAGQVTRDRRAIAFPKVHSSRGGQPSLCVKAAHIQCLHIQSPTLVFSSSFLS